MSKTILTKVDGFTPLPDLLVTKYGIVTASVWGSAWRYCQMGDGICRASLEKIGKRIGVSRQTVINHMEILVNDGFFEDTTPNLKNRPHIYRDTGKVGMYNRFGIGVNEIDSTGVNKVYSTVNEIDSRSQLDLLEDSIKETNKDKTFDKPYDRKKGREEAKKRKAEQQAKRGDMIDGMMQFADLEKERTNIVERIEQATRLTVNDRWYKEGVIDFLLQKDKDGQTIEEFTQVCNDNPYTMPKLFKIAEKPSYLKDVWNLAFPANNPNNPEIDSDGGMYV